MRHQQFAAFGGEAYPSIKEKAASLLYFIIKNHPFADGCKRIAATTQTGDLSVSRLPQLVFHFEMIL
ncbi:MAG: Fic family protein [Stomatobaculum sp.]